MSDEFKYIPYDIRDENLRGLIKNENVYNMKRGLSGIILPDDRDRELEEALKDMEYMKEMYPGEIKKFLHMVEEECDRLEYEGSPMLAEYPDREQIRRIARRIFDDIDMEGEMDIGHRKGCANPTLRNIIELLVCNEFYCRRDRYRRRRRRFY